MDNHFCPCGKRFESRFGPFCAACVLMLTDEERAKMLIDLVDKSLTPDLPFSDGDADGQYGDSR